MEFFFLLHWYTFYIYICGHVSFDENILSALYTSILILGSGTTFNFDQSGNIKMEKGRKRC